MIPCLSRGDPRRGGLRPRGLALVAMLLGGCATYEPAPVDPIGFEDAWRAVDPAAATAAVEAAHATFGAGTATERPPGFDLTDGIDLAEAEAVALFFNPALRRLRTALEIPRAEARTAAAWSDPELGVDGEVILENVDDPLVWAGTLGVTIPLSGRPNVARRLGEARIEEAEATILGAEWALLAALRLAWVDHAALEAQAALLDASITELDALIEASARFKAARALTAVDERLLVLERAHALEERLEVTEKREESRLTLIQHLGLHPEHDWRIDAELPAFAEDEHLHDAPLIRLLAHPSIRVALAAYAVAERTLELEVRRQVPDLRLGLGAGEDEGQSRLHVGLGLLPIPVWNRNEGGIGRATAERAIAALDVEAEIRALVHHRAIDRVHHEAALEKLRFLEEVVAPLADAQVRDARRLAVLGQLELLLLVEALSEVQRVRREILAARVNLMRARVEHASLAGPLEGLIPPETDRPEEPNR